jgi:hypothetical protein
LEGEAASRAGLVERVVSTWDRPPGCRGCAGGAEVGGEGVVEVLGDCEGLEGLGEVILGHLGEVCNSGFGGWLVGW